MQLATLWQSPRVKFGYQSIHRKKQSIPSNSAPQLWSMTTFKLLMSCSSLSIKSSTLLILMQFEVPDHLLHISRQSFSAAWRRKWSQFRMLEAKGLSSFWFWSAIWAGFQSSCISCFWQSLLGSPWARWKTILSRKCTSNLTMRTKSSTPRKPKTSKTWPFRGVL